MPNWCQNKLKLEHEKEEMILRAIEAFNKRKLISEFFPEPDYNAVKVSQLFQKYLDRNMLRILRLGGIGESETGALNGMLESMKERS